MNTISKRLVQKLLKDARNDKQHLMFVLQSAYLSDKSDKDRVTPCKDPHSVTSFSTVNTLNYWNRIMRRVLK